MCHIGRNGINTFDNATKMTLKFDDLDLIKYFLHNYRDPSNNNRYTLLHIFPTNSHNSEPISHSRTLNIQTSSIINVTKADLANQDIFDRYIVPVVSTILVESFRIFVKTNLLPAKLCHSHGMHHIQPSWLFFCWISPTGAVSFASQNTYK